MAVYRGENEPPSLGCTLRNAPTLGLNTACGSGWASESSFAAHSQGLCSLEGLPVWQEVFLLEEGDRAGQISSCLS